MSLSQTQDPRDIAKQVYPFLERAGVRNLSDEHLDIGQINVLDDDSNHWLCFYTLTDYEDKDSGYRWAIYDYKKPISSERRVTFSNLIVEDTSAEQVFHYAIACLAEYGLSPLQPMHKPRTIYPEGEQQELCL